MVGRGPKLQYSTPNYWVSPCVYDLDQNYNLVITFTIAEMSSAGLHNRKWVDQL